MGALTVLLGVIAALVAPTASGAPGAAHAHAAFTKTEKISRVNLINGTNRVVDKRTFSVSVDQTTDLRDRQEIDVSWTGAHPTGGLIADPNSAAAPQQEYPVVLMMCHGLASPSAPASKRISPETCWTQTPGERVEVSGNFAFPPYRLDRYASAADRALTVGVPNPLPRSCQKNPSAQHWVPFVAASGRVYKGGTSNASGTLICDAGIPPEQAAAAASLQPGNTTYAASNLQGTGSAKFVITTSESNASLGCSQAVPCSLVVIPIMGISCDPSGDNVPPADRPNPAPVEAQALALCSQKGAFAPGSISTNPQEEEDLSVSGELWWSASNWHNRITVPLSFAPPSNICSLRNAAAPTDIYGSYLMLQATQQWAPHFCLNPHLFPLQHVQTGEPEAKNLLAEGSIQAAFEAGPPASRFTKPVVQAPSAVTGFAVVYAIDDAKGRQYVKLRFDARLLAKLLTESYPSNSTVQAEDKALWNPRTHMPNPLDLADDPEFRALNPGMPTTLTYPEAAATILINSSDSDATTALTSYINADPEARAWLNGKPDPWGMVVNPKYKGIKLPVASFPLLDTFEPPGLYAPQQNPCLADDPVPWLPLVASPVENPATITLDLQFDIASSQIVCSGTTVQDQKLGAIGRETQGQRFVLGITSLADAKRYQLNTAALETHGGSTSNQKFTSAAGRTFVKPADSSLRAATALMRPDKAAGTWSFPYSAMRKESAGKSAYPGTTLVSTDVPTRGLPAAAAHDYAAFLDFVASAGQKQGLGNGQLPPGYLPLTAANGLGRMVNYTKAAAAAVAAQKGVVPSLTGSNPGSTSSPTPTPTSTGPSPGGKNGNLPPVKTPGGAGSSPATAQAPTASPSPTTSLSLGRTAAVSSTTSGLIFPLALLLALTGGAATLALWRIDRPRAAA